MAAGNNIIGEVGLKVVPVDPNAQFQAGVDQIIKRLEKQAQFQIKAAGLENVEQQANNAGQAFANAAIQAAGLTAAVYGIKAAVEGAIGKLSGLFDQLAQARAGFTSILHSEAAGGALLDDIREFARVSPFVTQELVNYSQQLLGVGTTAKEIIPLLKSTGDIISSVGGDTTNLGRVLFTLTQIKSIGALKGQDTMQLQNSLIPITKYLSEYLHKSSAEIIKLREDGKITADVVFAALNQQGEKVKGAMDRATRNIAGARAILSDTVTQLFQNQPVLNKVFEDVFKSIANFANKLGEAEFQEAFAQFFDGVNELYESLKPILAQIAELADSQGLNVLKLFGTTIGALGSALDAIPEGALDVLVRAFVALATLKAPLLLLGYVNSIRTMASSIIPATANLAKLGAGQLQTAAATRVVTAATDQYTLSLKANQAAQINAALPGIGAKGPGFLARNAGKIGTGVAIGGQIAGQALSGREGAGNKTAGGALQGASTGALIGSILGPEGAVAGAVIGAAYGGITAFFGEKNRKIKEDIEKMKKLGKEDAEAFISEITKQFGAGTGKTFNKYVDEIRTLTHEYETMSGKLNELKNAASETGLEFDIKPTPEMEGLLAQIDALKSEQAAAFDPIQENIKNLLAGLDKGEAGFIALTKVGKGGRVAADLVAVTDGLAKYGFTLEDINTAEGIEKVLSFIRVVDKLTTAQAAGIIADKKYNDGLAAAKINQAAIFDPGETKLEGQLELLNSTQTVESALLDLSTKEKRLNADILIQKQAELVASRKENELRLLGYDIATIDVGARIAGEMEILRLRGLVNGKAYGQRGPMQGGANMSQYQGQVEAQNRIDQRAQDKIDAEKAAQDAKDAAEKAAADALAFAEKIKSSTESLVDRLEGAAENIATAAESWVHSIKERTQFETAISAGRAISNTQKQIKEVVELAAGVAELKARGLSDEAIKSLGIDNVSDLKQVRKLLKANPNDLTTLSAGVSELTQKSIDLATSQEDKRTQKNIAEGVLAAAKELGMDVTKDEAGAVAGSFEFNINSDPQAIAEAIVAYLTKGVSA